MLYVCILDSAVSTQVQGNDCNDRYRFTETFYSCIILNIRYVDYLLSGDTTSHRAMQSKKRSKKPST